jgi:hypothetical protein
MRALEKPKTQRRVPLPSIGIGVRPGFGGKGQVEGGRCLKSWAKMEDGRWKMGRLRFPNVVRGREEIEGAF